MRKWMFQVPWLLALPLCVWSVEIDPVTEDLPAQMEFPSSQNPELSGLDTLIHFTELSLTDARELKSLIVEYQSVRKTFMNAKDPSKHTRSMVLAGYKALARIQQECYEGYFDGEFLEELAELARVAMKNGWVPA